MMENDQIENHRMEHNPKILCYINHYFGNTSAFVGKSTTGSAQNRLDIIKKVLERLRALSENIDIQVCGFPEEALIPIDIDLSPIGEPRFIVYESIERMFSHIDEYDWFLNIEDDILVPDNLIANAVDFASVSEVNEVWLPNRMEERSDGTMFCVDLEAKPGWTGLERKFRGETLGVAHVHHSGLFLLSREQLRYAATRVRLSRREEFYGGMMASAYANVHAPFLLWRARSSMLANHVIHADNWMFLETVRAAAQQNTFANEMTPNAVGAVTPPSDDQVTAVPSKTRETATKEAASQSFVRRLVRFASAPISRLLRAKFATREEYERLHMAQSRLFVTRYEFDRMVKEQEQKFITREEFEKLR